MTLWLSQPLLSFTLELLIVDLELECFNLLLARPDSTDTRPLLLIGESATCFAE